VSKKKVTPVGVRKNLLDSGGGRKRGRAYVAKKKQSSGPQLVVQRKLCFHPTLVNKER